MKQSASIYRMENAEKVCPFGLRAKDLLARRGFEIEDNKLASREETDAFKAEHNVATTPQIFIAGERIGGFDALRKHLGVEVVKDENKTSYQPIIALFGMTALMALAASWAAFATIEPLLLLRWFVAFSMCALALQKLRDLESFSNQFITYDLLAKRQLRYAYVYPFVEGLAGVGMIAGVLPWVVGPAALFIGVIGGASVIKAVYIEKRELKCACVGGNSNVPLGFISLTENVMMTAMAIWMMATALG